jgi:hypothetical protein
MTDLPTLISDWLANSGLDSTFGELFLAFILFGILNFLIYLYKAPMIVAITINLLGMAFLVALGFIPIWIVIVTFMALFAYGLIIMSGGVRT